MARQSQGIKVNVPRLKVIEALEKSLVKLETDYANTKKLDEEYEKAKLEWQKQVIKLALPLIDKAQSVNVRQRYNDITDVEFTLPSGLFVLPKEPSNNYECIPEYKYDNSKTEIESAIRLLRMCEDDTVNTATYSNISQYL